MGITSRLFPDEVTMLCNTASEPNDSPGPDGLDDVDLFTRFIRATKAPARDNVLAETAKARRGSQVFDRIGCASCHVRTLTTAPAGTKINGGTYAIPEAIGRKAFHPFGDFLLHDVGTGDGIVIPMPEHYGRAMASAAVEDLLAREFPELPQQGPHGAAVGRAAADPSDARRRHRDARRRRRPPSRRSRASEASLQVPPNGRPRSPAGVPEIPLTSRALCLA